MLSETHCFVCLRAPGFDLDFTIVESLPKFRSSEVPTARRPARNDLVHPAGHKLLGRLRFKELCSFPLAPGRSRKALQLAQRKVVTGATVHEIANTLGQWLCHFESTKSQGFTCSQRADSPNIA